VNESIRLLSSAEPRRAKLDDLPTLYALDQEIFGKLAYPYYVLRQWFDVHGMHFLVIDSPTATEGLCGYAMAALEPGCETAWLLGLGVRVGHRGHGLGDVLMTTAMDMCGEAGARNMRVTVNPANEVALGVYAKAGFSQVAVDSDYFGAGEPRLVLLRQL
jgi:ribosomal-protein-alanine N-acetyltransferase